MPAPDEVARLEARMDTAEEEIGKLRDRYHRLAAQVPTRDELEGVRVNLAESVDAIKDSMAKLREEFASFKGRVSGIAVALAIVVPMLTALGTAMLNKMLR